MGFKDIFDKREALGEGKPADGEIIDAISIPEAAELGCMLLELPGHLIKVRFIDEFLNGKVGLNLDGLLSRRSE